MAPCAGRPNWSRVGAQERITTAGTGIGVGSGARPANWSSESRSGAATRAAGLPCRASMTWSGTSSRYDGPSPARSSVRAASRSRGASQSRGQCPRCSASTGPGAHVTTAATGWVAGLLLRRPEEFQRPGVREVRIIEQEQGRVVVEGPRGRACVTARGPRRSSGVGCVGRRGHQEVPERGPRQGIPLGCPNMQDPQVAAPRPLPQRVEHGALAHPGVADDGQEPTGPGVGGRNQGVQPRQLP